MNQKGNSLILGVVIGAVVVLGLFGVYHLVTKQTQQQLYQFSQQPALPHTSLTPQATSSGSKQVCKIESLQKEQFLSSYIVKSGDTLFSVAQSQLGDQSRVNEIVILNNDRYINLSLNNPFLEPGWTLLLPPKDVNVPNSDVSSLKNLMELNASISNISNGLWHLNSSNGPVVKPDQNTKYISKANFNVGDCVTMLTIGTEVLAVQPQ